MSEKVKPDMVESVPPEERAVLSEADKEQVDEKRREAAKEKKSNEPTSEDLAAIDEERWNGIRAIMRNPDFDNAMNDVVTVLSQREREGLDAIAPAGTAQELSGILKEFEDLRGRTAGRSEFGPATARLDKCVDGIGDNIRRDGINDDPDSLRQLAMTMERLEETCGALAGRLRSAERPQGANDDSTINEAVIGLKRIGDTLNERKRGILAYRLDIQDYLDRRV